MGNDTACPISSNLHIFAYLSYIHSRTRTSALELFTREEFVYAYFYTPICKCIYIVYILSHKIQCVWNCVHTCKNCTFVYLHTYMYLYFYRIYTLAGDPVHLELFTHIVYTHKCLCMYVFTCICMRIVHIYVYMYLYRIYTLAGDLVPVELFTHMNICVCVYLYTYMYMYLYRIYTLAGDPVHVELFTHMNICVCAHLHTYVYLYISYIYSHRRPSTR